MPAAWKREPMPQEPPRRRRPQPSSNEAGGGWGPTIALFLGIVVAGLGIGALLGAFAQRSQNPSPVAQFSPAPDVTPVPQAPHGAVAIATLAPTHTAEPTPSPTPEPSPSDERSLAPSRAQSASAVPSPSPRPKPSPSVAPAVTAVPTPAPTVRPTARPIALATPPPKTPAPETATPPPIVGGAPLSIATSAPALVRRYIEALVHGDEAGAYAALGGAPGDAGLALSEESFIDSGAHVESLKTTPVSAMEAQVDAEIISAKGTYAATYRVRYGAHGAYISSHDYIKV